VTKVVFTINTMRLYQCNVKIVLRGTMPLNSSRATAYKRRRRIWRKDLGHLPNQRSICSDLLSWNQNNYLHIVKYIRYDRLESTMSDVWNCWRSDRICFYNYYHIQFIV